ncbi:uncharacterized protein BROUX77_001973 [Berkeleyomyces rouxiae]|uniref:uncharacterized protein n=1 Tax=Berkeleyomyces rouxiae TaxID=2035830 RepID=UPI003B7B4DCA
MPSIQALPQETVQRLNSSLVITSPDILVKELLENSIDAGATTVEVLISPNTIDRIQVRDNGCGISPNDYDALGRRSHTNKLAVFSELAYKGGSTFGFRGEALASANTCGTVVITTRTKEETLASILVLARGQGGVAEKSPSSGLVGTAVTVTRLFNNLPVRKQQLIQEGAKTLVKIKEILLRLAIAKPFLKLVLKVPGSRKSDWCFSPSGEKSVKDVVLQAFARQLASSCTNVEVTDGGYTYAAFIPSREANRATVAGKGAYLSVDSRPLDPNRGTMKKIVKIFRDELSKVLGECQKPFLQFNLTCPSGSYDVNVDIFKTEVVFADEPHVISLFRQLLKEVYGINSPTHCETLDDLLMEDFDIDDPEKIATASPITHMDPPIASLPGPETHSHTETTIIEINDSSSTSYDSPSSDLELSALLDSTPPTSVIAQPTSSESVICTMDIREIRMERMDVQTQWEVNMVEVGDEEGVPLPLKIETIEVLASDYPIISSYKDPSPSSVSSPKRLSINPWTLSQEQAERCSRKEANLDGSATDTSVQNQEPPSESGSLSDTMELEILRPSDLPRGDLDVPRGRRGLSTGLDRLESTHDLVPDNGVVDTESFAHRGEDLVRIFEHYDQASSIPQKRQMANTEMAPPSSGSPISFTPVSRPFKRVTVAPTNPTGRSEARLDTGRMPNVSRVLRQTHIAFDSVGTLKPMETADRLSSFSPQTVDYCDELQDDTLSLVSHPPPVIVPYKPPVMDKRIQDSLQTSGGPYGLAQAANIRERTKSPKSIVEYREARVLRRRHNSREYSPPTQQRGSLMFRAHTRTVSRDIQNLPLESIPEGKQTQSLVLPLEVSMEGLVKHYKLMARCDRYVEKGVDELSMLKSIATEVDLQCVKDRTHAVLELWTNADMAGKFKTRLSFRSLKGKGI